MASARWVDRFLVLDAHNDSLILRQSRDDPMDLAVVHAAYQVDLPRLRQGGMDCLFCMVGDNDLRQAHILIDAVYEMARLHEADFVVCSTASAVRAARAAGRIALVPTLEGQKMLQEDLSVLRNFYRLGVRLASITHGGGRSPELQRDPSYFGYISAQERENLRRQSRGLTHFGFEALAEMGRLGIAVDLAHINDAAYWEVLERAQCGVCYTHGSCYALCPHSRALTDEMMRALAQKGGVMGIVTYPRFIDVEKPTLDRLCEHFLHALEVMGADHVGLGTDYDGTEGLVTPIVEHVGHLEALFEALARRGVDEETLAKIAGENFLRMLPA